MQELYIGKYNKIIRSTVLSKTKTFNKNLLVYKHNLSGLNLGSMKTFKL